MSFVPIRSSVALFLLLAGTPLLTAQAPVRNPRVIRSTPPKILQPPRRVQDLDKPGAFDRPEIFQKPNVYTPKVTPTPTALTPAMPRPENVIEFDPQGVELIFRESRWFLAGGGLFKSFGSREEEARKALQMIRSLGLNQLASVGRPLPIFEYWLSDGRAPSGLTAGLRQVPLNPKELRVEKVHGEWFLRDETRVLFRFGGQEREARQALAVIRKYGFETVALIGQAVPSMYLFLRDTREGVTGPRTQFEGALKQGPLHEQTQYQDDKSNLPKSRSKKTNLTAFQLPTSMIPPLRDTAPKTRRDTIAQTWAAGSFQSIRSRSPGVEAPQNTNRIPFDWRQARVKLEQGHWVLRVGSTILADLGTDYQAARVSWGALLHYRFTEMHQLNPDVPETRYFLIRGQAPKGIMPGMVSIPIQPDLLSVRAEKKDFVLMQRGREVINCGPNREDAERLLGVLQYYQFDRLCQVRSGLETRFQFFTKAR